MLCQCGLTPIEVAALLQNHEAVMALFPFTSPISIFPKWCVDGIMVHGNSLDVKLKVHSDDILGITVISLESLSACAVQFLVKLALIYRFLVEYVHLFEVINF